MKIGDVVRLNSGSVPLVVVDMALKTVTVAWRNGVKAVEAQFSRECVHHVSPKQLEVCRGLR